MTPAELAARTYIEAWTVADRAARPALLEACFAEDGRIRLRGQVQDGRAALAAAIDAFEADPRRRTARLTSVIDAGQTIFRFRARIDEPDGSFVEMLDVGEVDDRGRIFALYTFLEPLAQIDRRSRIAGGGDPGGSADGAGAHPRGIDPTGAGTAQVLATPAERAARRYIDLWSERDPAARAAALEACFATDGRFVTGGRTFHGRAAFAAVVESLMTSPRGLRARETTVIDAAGAAFRFGSVAEFADGSPAAEAFDTGEVDGDGRIAVLYAFGGPLRDAAA